MGLVLVLVIVIVLVILFGVVLYNGLVSSRNRVDNGWAQIDVQLKRRHDLIPNLVESVKGYAAHEKSTFDAVINARNAAMAGQSSGNVAQTAQAENVLSGALKSLFALSEAYPDLKANQNFLSLQEELTSTEDRIAYARQFYNDEVRKYNTKIQTIPTKFVANMGGFTAREYFEVDDADKNPVEVKF